MEVGTVFKDTSTERYCAVCDHMYRKGTYKSHRMTGAHIASVGQRRSMARWYRGNGWKYRPRAPRADGLYG